MALVLDANNLPNPPVAIKEVLDVVLLLLGNKKREWIDIQMEMSNPNEFLAKIQNINVEKIKGKKEEALSQLIVENSVENLK